MSDNEELLAGFDSDEEDTDDEVTDNRPPESTGFKQLRAHAKKLERDLNRHKKEVEELRAFRTEVEQKERLSTLTTAGLNEKQATVFLRTYDAVTPENLSEFKNDVLGISAEKPEDTSTGFGPTSVIEDRGMAGTIGKAEFETLMRENPAKAWALGNSGKVDFSRP